MLLNLENVINAVSRLLGETYSGIYEEIKRSESFDFSDSLRDSMKKMVFLDEAFNVLRFIENNNLVNWVFVNNVEYVLYEHKLQLELHRIGGDNYFLSMDFDGNVYANALPIKELPFVTNREEKIECWLQKIFDSLHVLSGGD